MNFILRLFRENADARAKVLGKESWKDIPVPDEVELTSDLMIPGENPGGIAADVYRPADKNLKNLPVLIFIHGGGFFVGDKRFNRPFCNAMAREGCLIYICDYRLLDTTDAFGMMADINGVFRLVKETAEGFGGDLSKVFVIGESAGAFLTEYAAAIEKSVVLQKEFGIKPSGLPIKGCIFFSGMFYTTRFDPVGIVYPKDLFGKRYKDKGLRKLLNPENPEVIDNLPPAYLISSRGDFLRNYTLRYARKLKKRGHPCKVFYLKNSKHLRHAFVSVAPSLPESIRVQKWIGKFTGGKGPVVKE